MRKIKQLTYVLPQCCPCRTSVTDCYIMKLIDCRVERSDETEEHRGLTSGKMQISLSQMEPVSIQHIGVFIYLMCVLHMRQSAAMHGDEENH